MSERARITHEDDGAKYVRTISGQVHVLVKGSINGTPAPVGTSGTVEYVTTSAWALHFFRPDTGPIERDEDAQGHVERFREGSVEDELKHLRRYHGMPIIHDPSRWTSKALADLHETPISGHNETGAEHPWFDADA